MKKILHICSNYCSTKIFPNMLYALNFLFGDNFLYCPVKFNANISKYSYLDFNDSILKQNKKIAKVSPCYSSLDTLFFFSKRKKILKDIGVKFNIKSFERIMAHSLFTDGWVANKIHDRFNIPYCVFIQNGDINFFFKKIPFLRKKAINILIESNSIIMCSSSIRDDLFERFIPEKYQNLLNSKISIIPFGIENNFINDVFFQPNKLKNQNEIKILTVGTIDRNKNQITVAKAINELIFDGYKIRYTLAGNIVDNEYFNELKKFPFVNYVGKLNYDELKRTYRDNDIFILASQYETFGLVYAEALTQGVPVIYTKKQGFDKIFKDGYVGYSVNYKNIDEIKDKVIKVMLNYNELVENIKKSYKRFSWENVSKEYYKAIVEGNNENSNL